MGTEINAAFYRGNKTFAVETATAADPGPGEVSVRIAYCGICGTDMHVYHGNMDARVGLNRVIGHEMSGHVAAVGDGVEVISVGQKVVVRPLDHCGDCPACDAGHKHICHNLKFLGLDTDGAMQEIWTVPAHTIHVLPDDLRMDHAALIEPVAGANAPELAFNPRWPSCLRGLSYNLNPLSSATWSVVRVPPTNRVAHSRLRARTSKELAPAQTMEHI